MWWAAAPVAVSRLSVTTAWRRPKADDQERDGPTPRVPPGCAGSHRGKAPEGRPRGQTAKHRHGSNEVSELELNLAAMPLTPAMEDGIVRNISVLEEGFQGRV